MKPNDSSNVKLTDHLKALLLGGAIAFGAVHSTEAAQVAQPKPKTDDSLDARIEKVREQVKDQQNILIGNGQSANGASLMWWRNVWGNGGGWRNWRNGGWRNGGGWGNFHNF